MTPGIASSKAQTLVTQANLDHCTTRTEKLTAQARAIDNLLQQAGELRELSKYTEAIALQRLHAPVKTSRRILPFSLDAGLVTQEIAPEKCIKSYKTPILTVLESVMLSL